MTDEEVAAYLAWRRDNPREARIQDELRQYQDDAGAMRRRGIAEMTRRIAILGHQAEIARLEGKPRQVVTGLREEAEDLTEVRDRMSRRAYGVPWTGGRPAVEAVLESDYTPSTKLVCIRAILDGVRGPLPAGDDLVALGQRTGVSRRSSFRAAIDLAGQALSQRFGDLNPGRH